RLSTGSELHLPAAHLLRYPWRQYVTKIGDVIPPMQTNRFRLHSLSLLSLTLHTPEITSRGAESPSGGLDAQTYQKRSLLPTIFPTDTPTESIARTPRSTGSPYFKAEKWSTMDSSSRTTISRLNESPKGSARSARYPKQLSSSGAVITVTLWPAKMSASKHSGTMASAAAMLSAPGSVPNMWRNIGVRDSARYPPSRI